MKRPVEIEVSERAGDSAPEALSEHARLAAMSVGGLVGFRTLLYKEVLRFWKVAFQTVAAPVLTAVLYLLIFGHVLEGRVQVYDQVTYTSFLVPGLVMMSVLQNAFANSSSSLIQSKITGNLVFIMLPPLSHWEMFGAYVAASVIRGICVGLGVLIVTALLVPLHLANIGWVLVFAVLGAGILGTLGLIAGIWAEKFDQLAAFQNFLIMPATFLAGVFYSIHSLPPVWQVVSHANPFFYMIDGFRYGFFGVSDVSPLYSLAVVGIAFVVLAALALRLLRSGYKLRH
ncbi:MULTISPECIES: ABC transporter permease [unclassified Cupriavidus]|uniref:ABC transporter permease n=1 Tax=Cupriavidus sp. H19C3 TaxID=3241603 RepID=UPI003BF88414